MSTCWPWPGLPGEQQRRQQPDEPVQRGQDVGGRDDLVHRRRAVQLDLAGDQSRLGVDDRGVRRPRRLRTVLTEAGDRQHHEAGVAGRQVRPVEVEPGEDARSEVLDHDVGRGGQIGDELGAAGRVEVHRDVALPRVLLRVVARQAVDDLAPQPCDVALGRLDLDDVGAEVGQHPAGQRPGQHPRQVEHADPVQRVHGGHTVTDGGLVGAANVGVTYGVMSMSSSSISPASTPCFHVWWASRRRGTPA